MDSDADDVMCDFDEDQSVIAMEAEVRSPCLKGAATIGRVSCIDIYYRFC